MSDLSMTPEKDDRHSGSKAGKSLMAAFVMVAEPHAGARMLPWLMAFCLGEAMAAMYNLEYHLDDIPARSWKEIEVLMVTMEKA